MVLHYLLIKKILIFFLMLDYFLERVVSSPLVVVVTPSLPWDGGSARTAIQVHAVNFIEVG